MNIDKFGRVSISSDEAFEALYSGKVKTLHNLFFKAEVANEYNQAININRDSIHQINIQSDCNIDLQSYDKEFQSNWFIPGEYKNFPIESWLLSQCKSELELIRIQKELNLYNQYNMIQLLIYLKYLVDTMRSNNIVWGVGRGSSVASFALYLMGVHKINSLEYDIDINEFLKGETNG